MFAQSRQAACECAMSNDRSGMLGNHEYGIEKNALKQDGRYYDEVLMAMDLTRD